MQDSSLIILRGLPGAGKSALAKVISENGKYPVFSVDDYFTSPSGEYRFEYDKNHLAYRHCESRTEDALRNGHKKVILDNVFSMDWEMEPYFRMAAACGYAVHVVTVENRHGSKNIHGISDDQLRKMAEKFNVVLLP